MGVNQSTYMQWTVDRARVVINPVISLPMSVSREEVQLIIWD